MSFINKLKTKFQTDLVALSTYTVTQEIILPIYEASLKGAVDSEDIVKKCLAIQKLNEIDNGDYKILKDAWKSRYFRKGQDNDRYEEFSDLITVIEDKLNSLPALSASKMKFTVLDWWIMIYTKGSSIEWHDHSEKVDTFTRFSATYYVSTPEKSQPIEFKDKNTILKIPVSEDKVLFFPSVLKHRVIESVNDEPRIMIGFNFTGLL